MKPTRKLFYYALLALVVVSGFATVHAVYAQATHNVVCNCRRKSISDFRPGH